MTALGMYAKTGQIFCELSLFWSSSTSAGSPCSLLPSWFNSLNASECTSTTCHKNLKWFHSCCIAERVLEPKSKWNRTVASGSKVIVAHCRM
jgi:hypothetical protein